MRRWGRQGPTKKDGARDSTASEIQPAVGGRDSSCVGLSSGPQGTAQRLASGQTPKKPEEQAGARRKSTKRPRVPGDQWVTGARVRSRARSQCRRNGRRGDWREAGEGPIGSKVCVVGPGRRHSGAAVRANDTGGGPGSRNQASGPGRRRTGLGAQGRLRAGGRPQRDERSVPCVRQADTGGQRMR